MKYLCTLLVILCLLPVMAVPVGGLPPQYGLSSMLPMGTPSSMRPRSTTAGWRHTSR